MEVCRQYGMGHAFFRSKFFTDNVKGIYHFTERFNRHPALIPAMTWQHNECPEAPANLLNGTTAETTTLSWLAPANCSGAPYLLYNIYASRQYPVDIRDARNLIAVRTITTSHTMKTVEGMHYAVTAMDRYGNESVALQEKEMPTTSPSAHWLRHDGKSITLPAWAQTADAEFAVIESITGCIVSSQKWGMKLNISSLPGGVYSIKSVNRKGVTHHLGHFIIKR